MGETKEGTGLGGAIEAGLAGGPERHHLKTAEQGKMPVRERVARLLDEGSFSEEALLANWDQEGLGADGVVCLLYTSPSPRDGLLSRMPSSA